MADVPDQPHPLDADEFAAYKQKVERFRAWGADVSLADCLVATVEARDTRVRGLETQLADAHENARTWRERYVKAEKAPLTDAEVAEWEALEAGE